LRYLTLLGIQLRDLLLSLLPDARHLWECIAVGRSADHFIDDFAILTYLDYSGENDLD
jgi:hypothetical protein